MAANGRAGGDAPAEAPLQTISSSEVVLLGVIGRGSYGDVFKAQWRGRVVAAKRVARSCVTTEEKVLSRLSHRHIIRYHGTFEREQDRYIVTDFAELGSLFTYLQLPDLVVDTRTIFDWSRQIASGMEYLHSHNIIHRDLKSPNVLVCCGTDEPLVLRICDFGESRVAPDSVYMTFAGTPSWCAPEILKGEKASVRSDVHSFGVVLWEMLTREIPFKDFEHAVIMYLVGSREMSLPIPPECPPAFAQLMTRCWQYPPQGRPMFADILRDLDLMAGEPSIERATTTFIASKRSWMPGLTSKFAQLQKLEQQLRERERAVEERERRLRVLEMRLARHAIGEPPGHLRSRGGSMDANGRPRQIERWSEDDVAAWVECLPGPLAEYAGAFRTNNIGGTRLGRIDDETLRALGVLSLGHRESILAAVRELLHSVQYPPLPSTSPQKKPAQQPAAPAQAPAPSASVSRSTERSGGVRRRSSRGTLAAAPPSAPSTQSSTTSQQSTATAAPSAPSAPDRLEVSVELQLGCERACGAGSTCFVRVGEGDAADYVRDVEFVPAGALSGHVVSRAPFEYTCANDRPPTSVECRVRFSDDFKKKVKRHVLRLRPDGSADAYSEHVRLVPR